MEEFISPWMLFAIVAVVCLIAELTTGTFYILCFAFGAIITMLFSFVNIDIKILAIIFSISSVACVCFIRPLLLRFEDKKKAVKMNVDAIIGAKGIVSEEIPEYGYGRVKAGGDDWKAQCENGVKLAVGTRIEVIGRDSLILTVKEI